MATVMLNRVHYPVNTLGPGRRAGIWFQGCTIGCAGCVSRDTWPEDPDRWVEVGEVVHWLDGLPHVDGVTLTGGEPTQQPVGLRALLAVIDVWRRSQETEIDILLYSGYPMSTLRRHAHWLDIEARVDVVIAGPYVQRRNPGGLWRGSANQKIVPTSELGLSRYNGAADRPGERRLQVSARGDHVWMIGIPGPRAMGDLEGELAASGVTAGEASWRP